MADYVSHGGGGNGSQFEAEDLTLVYAAMMEELGVKRKDDLPLEDHARVPDIPFAQLLNLRPQSNRVQDPEISEKITGWKNLHLEDDDPANAQIDSMFSGQLGRIRRKAEKEAELARSNQSIGGGFPSRTRRHGRGELVLSQGRSSAISPQGNSRGRGEAYLPALARNAVHTPHVFSDTSSSDTSSRRLDLDVAINRVRSEPLGEPTSNSRSQGRRGPVGESTSNSTYQNLVAAQTHHPAASPKVKLVGHDDFMAFIKSSSGLSSSKFAPEKATSVKRTVSPVQGHEMSQTTSNNGSPVQQPPPTPTPAANEGGEMSRPPLNNGPPVQQITGTVNERVVVQSNGAQNSETLESLNVKITKDNEATMKGAVRIVKSPDQANLLKLQVRVNGNMLVDEELWKPEVFKVDANSLTFRADLQAPTWYIKFPVRDYSLRFAAAFTASRRGRVQRSTEENQPSNAVEVANQVEFPTTEKEELIPLGEQEARVQAGDDSYSAAIQDLASDWTDEPLERLDSIIEDGFMSKIIKKFGDTELVLDTNFLELATRTLGLGIGTSIYAPGNHFQQGVPNAGNISDISPKVIPYQNLAKTEIWNMLPHEMHAALVEGTYKNLVQKSQEITSAETKSTSNERHIYTSEELLQIRNAAPKTEKSSAQQQKALWSMIDSANGTKANSSQQHIRTANEAVNTTSGQMSLEVVKPAQVGIAQTNPTASEVEPADNKSTKSAPYAKHEVKLSCGSLIESFQTLNLSSKGSMGSRPGEKASSLPSLLALDNKIYKGKSGLATSQWATDRPEVSTTKEQLKVEKRTPNLTSPFTRQEAPTLSSRFALNASHNGSPSISFVPQVTSPVLPSPDIASSTDTPIHQTVLVPGPEPNNFIGVTGILKVDSIPVVAHHSATIMSRNPESGHRRNSSLKANASVFSPNSQRDSENNRPPLSPKRQNQAVRRARLN